MIILIETQFALTWSVAKALAQQLPKVAHAGVVAVPSKFNELVRLPEPVYPSISRPHRGSIHHHWIFTVQKNELVAIPKLPYLEHDETFMDLEKLGLHEPWWNTPFFFL